MISSLATWTHKLGSKEFAAEELHRAFESWVPYTNLKFEPIEDYHAADIRVVFGRYHHGDRYPFDGPGYTLAHAYFPYEFGRLLLPHPYFLSSGAFGGDIHFDEDEDWTVNVTAQGGGLDFFTVAQHEIGHSLGLSHRFLYFGWIACFHKGVCSVPIRPFAPQPSVQLCDVPVLQGPRPDRHRLR